jgi:hypothetical protein
MLFVADLFKSRCLDRLLIFGESHLRRVLASYAAYYNQARMHLALGKDAPLGRSVQRSGVIIAIPILSGLHHQYVRIWFRKGQRMSSPIPVRILVCPLQYSSAGSSNLNAAGNRTAGGMQCRSALGGSLFIKLCATTLLAIPMCLGLLCAQAMAFEAQCTLPFEEIKRDNSAVASCPLHGSATDPEATGAKSSQK